MYIYEGSTAMFHLRKHNIHEKNISRNILNFHFSLTNNMYERHFDTIYSLLDSLQCLIEDPLFTYPISGVPLPHLTIILKHLLPSKLILNSLVLQLPLWKRHSIC